MSLVADYSATSSSSSSESEDSNDEREVKNSSIPSKTLLPSASSLLVSGSKKTGEVFQNRFQQEERAKKASLEHHVKMVENDQHLKTKNGRKICWNYRKGRCRFGSKCQYAHDSDLVVAEPDKVEKNEQTIPSEEKNAPNTNETTKQGNKRKRPGLGDSLTPGKRVLSSYSTQQQQHQQKQKKE